VGKDVEGRLPAPPAHATDLGSAAVAARCKLCNAPFRGPGDALMRATSIAERMLPEEFSRLMARFYGAAAGAIDEWDGIVDKFVGDSAVALFIPGFAGSDHAADAIEAARPYSSRPATTGRSRGFRSVPVCTPVRRSWARSGRAMPETSRRSATRSIRPRGSRASPGGVRS
jgi:hypothetical protein